MKKWNVFMPLLIMFAVSIALPEQGRPEESPRIENAAFKRDFVKADITTNERFWYIFDFDFVNALVQPIEIISVNVFDMNGQKVEQDWAISGRNWDVRILTHALSGNHPLAGIFSKPRGTPLEQATVSPVGDRIEIKVTNRILSSGEGIRPSMYTLSSKNKYDSLTLRVIYRADGNLREVSHTFTSEEANIGLKEQPAPQIQQIQQLERFLQENPGVFNLKVHNELRHLYGGINPRRSMEHSDVILQHSLMDDYILHILSGWQIDKDISTARANLLMNAQSFPDLRFVAAACFLKIGDLYATDGNFRMAKSSYLKAAEDKSSDMAQYRVLAEERLRGLEEQPGRREEEPLSNIPDQPQIWNIPEGRAPNLVVLVHGCCTDDLSEWNALANDILKRTNPREWEIVVWDWSDSTPVPPTLDYDSILEYVDFAFKHAFGESQKLEASIKRYSLYKYIHLIGHSTGASVIDSAAKALVNHYKLKGKEKPFIHLTFLDAYTPDEDTSDYGNIVNYPHYSEHYVDYGLKYTDTCLRHAFNFKITYWRPLTGGKGGFGHQWPRNWYKESITATAPGFKSLKYGHPLSREGGYSKYEELTEKYPKDKQCSLVREDKDCEQTASQQPCR